MKIERHHVAQSPYAQAINAGLRVYMLRIYNLMATALFVSGGTAYFAFNLITTRVPSEGVTLIASDGLMLTQLGASIFGSFFAYVIMFAPLVLVFILGFRINKMSVSAAHATFWAYSVVMGLSLTTILLQYTSGSVFQVFFITAAAFSCLSLYGYTTQTNLQPIGTFLLVGLFGIIIASIVNIFMESSVLNFAISIIGVLIFAGLTAYDTQKLKNMYAENDTAVLLEKKALMGALTLYLDFINMMIFLLRLIGDRR